MRTMTRRFLAASAILSVCFWAGLTLAHAKRGRAVRLWDAVIYGRTDEVRSLLDEGANVNDYAIGDRNTLLMSAALYGRIDIVRLFLERGVEIEAKDAAGKTALMYAALSPKTEEARDIAKLLIKKGADLEAKDQTGKAAWTYLKEKRFDDLLPPALIEEEKQRGMKEAAERAAKEAALELERVLPKIIDAENLGDTAKEAGKASGALSHYIEALKLIPKDANYQHEQRLREKTLRLGLSLKLAAPEEAKRYMIRAQAVIEKAAGVADYRAAAAELEKAVALAPWWGKAYYNLGLIQEKAEDYAAAAKSLNLYLLAAPKAENSEAVKNKIIKLEIYQERAGKQ